MTTNDEPRFSGQCLKCGSPVTLVHKATPGVGRRRRADLVGRRVVADLTVLMILLVHVVASIVLVLEGEVLMGCLAGVMTGAWVAIVVFTLMYRAEARRG